MADVTVAPSDALPLRGSTTLTSSASTFTMMPDCRVCWVHIVGAAGTDDSGAPIPADTWHNIWERPESPTAARTDLTFELSVASSNTCYYRVY